MSGMMGKIRGIQIRRYELVRCRKPTPIPCRRRDNWNPTWGWKLKDAINYIALCAESTMKEAHAWVAEDPENRRVTFMRKDF